MLVDEDGIVRIWNAAAEVITGLAGARRRQPAGSREVVPGWAGDRGARRRSRRGRALPRAETVPLELERGERWLSISGVSLPGGTVYAFRDLTEERRVERLKSEFVSTISHELRTPLAAIYGAALTLQRKDPALEAQRERLLDVVAAEAERLARIVNDILWVSRVESGTLHIAVEKCDPTLLALAVVEAAQAHLPREPDADARGRRRSAVRRGGRRQGAPDPLQPRRQRGQVLARRRRDPRPDHAATTRACASPSIDDGLGIPPPSTTGSSRSSIASTPS